MLVLVNIIFFYNSILSICDLNHISKGCHSQNSHWEINKHSSYFFRIE